MKKVFCTVLVVLHRSFLFIAFLAGADIVEPDFQDFRCHFHAFPMNLIVRVIPAEKRSFEKLLVLEGVQLTPKADDGFPPH